MSKKPTEQSSQLLRAAAVTDRKLMENAFHNSENRHRFLVENSPLCIHEIGIDGKIISINQAGLLMLGAKDESAVRGFLYLDGK